MKQKDRQLVAGDFLDYNRKEIALMVVRWSLSHGSPEKRLRVGMDSNGPFMDLQTPFRRLFGKKHIRVSGGAVEQVFLAQDIQELKNALVNVERGVKADLERMSGTHSTEVKTAHSVRISDTPLKTAIRSYFDKLD